MLRLNSSGVSQMSPISSNHSRQLVLESPTKYTLKLCRTMTVLDHWSTTASFYWLLIEGIQLYTLLVVTSLSGSIIRTLKIFIQLLNIFVELSYNIERFLLSNIYLEIRYEMCRHWLCFKMDKVLIFTIKNYAKRRS